jgi:ABC-2 type transport system permease protein
VISLIAFNVIPATITTAVALGAVLLVLVRLGWRFSSTLFDRERLVTGTK